MAALDAFATEGLAIARVLKAELSDCRVSYYDEAAAARSPEIDDLRCKGHRDPWDYDIE